PTALNYPNDYSKTKTTCPSSNSSTNDTKTQLPLSTEDKKKIKNIFENLDEKNMWVLSSSTVVERKMMEFAMSCEYEHPVHSMIMDPDDRCWTDVFTSEELDEIRKFNLKPLPQLPEEMKLYMDEFRTYNDIEELYEKVQERKLHPKRDPCLKWVQDSLYNCLKLFFAEYLPLTDQTEGDLMRRIWSCVDTVFDFSSLKCRSGEKSSVSSSEGRNYDRCLGGVKKLTRKATGHKMDMIFKNESGEFGCAECGRFYDLNSTKELMDGSFKLPKIMKDMLAHVCNDAPSSIRKLEIAGFMILENKITLISLDVPAGYTCRINRFESLYFPT
ncbi:hypothetical protein BD770DRAFT_309044, partial [Pilaira anomala]